MHKKITYIGEDENSCPVEETRRDRLGNLHASSGVTMQTIKVICKNHGIIQTIEGGMGRIGTPAPWAFCPICGEKTIVERWVYDNPTEYAKRIRW